MRLFQAVAPESWILRETTERDYGVDAYVELVSPGGDITGKLMSAQLKAHTQLKWRSGTGKARVATSPAIKTSTTAYWFNLPVPVFLFVADLAEHKIHYISVKEHIRRNYQKLNTQESMTFPLLDQLNLDHDIAVVLLEWFYLLEKNYDRFRFHLMNLIAHADAFSDFILDNLNRDIFLDVEIERHLQFRSLHETYDTVSTYLNYHSQVEPLAEVYRRDRERWQDPYTHLHEETLASVLKQIGEGFPALVRRAVELVASSQKSYWEQRDPVLYTVCTSSEMKWVLKKIENDVQRAREGPFW